MSTETGTGTTTARIGGLNPWLAGAIGGVLGSVLFGLIMVYAIEDPVLSVAIPNMYTIEATPQDPAPLAGWAFHLFHGAVLGLAFVALLQIEALGDLASDNATAGALGLGYGLLTWVVLAVFVMPIWLDAVGFPAAPEIPNVGTLSAVGHALYGVVLGIVYSVTAEA